MLKKKDLKEAISKSSLKKGDILFCHSDLSILKDIDFKHSLLPPLIYKLLIKKIGVHGTLVVPTFTYSFCKNGIFDNQYGHCKPKIYVKYLREYFLVKNTRITYDRDIEYLNLKQRYIGKENSRVLELKPDKGMSLDELYLDFPFSRIRNEEKKMDRLQDLELAWNLSSSPLS